MTRLNLDARDETVKQFVLELAREFSHVVLELNGRPVLRVSPPGGNRQPAGDEWTDGENDRRCDLVDRKIAGAITPDEERELADLQRKMLRYRDEVAPLPLAEARRLHQELMDLAKAHRANFTR